MILETKVNGQTRQSQNTKELIFDIPTLIETCSMGITLMPGDIIATGTPAGVGIGKSPPIFLQEGDQIEVSITSLGTLTNVIGSAKEAAPTCEPVRVRTSKSKSQRNSQLVNLPNGSSLYIDASQIDSQKPSIVFVHGLGGASTNYDAVIAASGVGKNFNIVKFDLEGHGLSPLASQSLTLDSFADSILSILEHYGISKATVVGHSMGGLIATTLAAKEPSKVERLFLIGPTKAFAEAGVQALGGRAKTVEDGGMPSIAKTVTAAGTSQKTKDSRPLAHGAVNASLLNSPPLGYAAACRALAAAKDPDYANITAKTLILAGSEDKTSPAATTEFLKSKISTTTVVPIDNVGHWHLLEDVETVAKELASFVN